MMDLYCEDCGTGQGRLQSVREPHFGRFCLPCLAKREAPSETTLTPMAITDADRKALHNAGQKVAEWTQKRDQLIRDAVGNGGSLREVGAAVGMSHMAVKFITHGRK